jgi:hypothetical protein
MDIKTIKDWFITEFRIENIYHERIDRFLETINLLDESIDNKDDLVTKWTHYCGSDKQLALLIENLSKVLKKQSEFRWKACELVWWWNEFFKCKNMIQIQALSDPVEHCMYVQKVCGENVPMVIREMIQATTRKSEVDWKLEINELLEKNILELANDGGKITKNNFINSLKPGVCVMVSIDIRPENYSAEKYSKFLENIKQKEITICYSQKLKNDEFVVSDVKKGLIFCPFILGNSVYANNNTYQLNRYAIITNQNTSYPYVYYQVEDI